MTNDTETLTLTECSVDSCETAPHCRGMCESHYRKARRRGDLPKVRGLGPRITDIDMEAGTATCEVHGPETKLRVRRRAGGAEYYACRACDRCGSGGKWSPEARRAARRRGKYRISDAEFVLLEQAQAGRCLICRVTPDCLVVDHCHETGVVRGLLCHRCNVALGWMNDSAENLARAAKYLRRKIA